MPLTSISFMKNHQLHQPATLPNSKNILMKRTNVEQALTTNNSEIIIDCSIIFSSWP